MAEPFISEIRMFGGNFAPVGFAFCEGQLLPIAQYEALFSLIGTIYGGDGQVTFGLPDLRGRLPMHKGQGPGLTPHTEGELSGAENVTMIQANLPPHQHSLNATGNPGALAGGGSGDTPAGNLFAGSATDENYSPVANANGVMAPMQVTGTTGPVGGGQPLSITQPFLTVSFIIALEGIYPSRN